MIEMLIVCALAVGQIIEIWNHSELTATARAYVETIENEWVKTLLTCPFCQGPWVAVVALATYSVLPALTYVLAITRVAQLVNDLTADKNRTPK